MREVIDYLTMKGPSFWELVDDMAKDAAVQVEAFFSHAMEKKLTQEEAVSALDALFIDSHARIKKDKQQLVAVTPLSHQCNRDQLKTVDNLWWVDHFTGGINPYTTINTYIQRKVSTHFILGFHKRPLYVVPLCHGTWHEPRRNKDSVGIEMVNPGALHQDHGVWHFWAGPLPLPLVQELPPVRLPVPYRGISALLPFTRDQIINNLLLKRIVIAAFPGKLIPERMTQHSDWRETKTDMGPIWPLQEINAAAFDSDPVLEYQFIQQYEDDPTAHWTTTHDDDHDDTDNPQYKEEETTKGLLEWDTKDVQTFLVTQRHVNLKIDGQMGPKTSQAIKEFQRQFNLKIDGIPGPQTLTAMQSINKQ
jgi:N-acetyl-anhydromuramyl-L-alanine amidase AmpD